MKIRNAAQYDVLHGWLCNINSSGFPTRVEQVSSRFDQVINNNVQSISVDLPLFEPGLRSYVLGSEQTVPCPCLGSIVVCRVI